MTTTSISNIKSSLATLQENLPNFRKYLKENYTDTMNTGQRKGIQSQWLTWWYSEYHHRLNVSS